MARKSLMGLHGEVVDARARLEFYKATPAFQARERRGEWPITILRQAVPDFEFGNDYAEFFDGLNPAVAEPVFSGAMAPSNDRKFVYVDSTIEVGRTYAYWVATASNTDPVGPAPVRVRDARVWWPWTKIEARLRDLARRHPGLARLEPCGHTVRGRELLALRAGNRERALALVGTIHPGESGPELQIPVLERLLAERTDLLQAAGVAILPSVGVDEREREVLGLPWYLRTNANGVDLNRNFDADWDTTDYGYGLDSTDPRSMTYRGRAAASEPETRAVARFIEQVRPRAVFSFHCLASLCGDAFLVARAARDDAEFAASARRLAQAYGCGMYPDANAETPIAFACTPGSLPQWGYRRFGIPTFDLELGTNEDARPCVTDRTTPELVATYQARHYGGVTAVLELLAAAGA